MLQLTKQSNGWIHYHQTEMKLVIYTNTNPPLAHCAAFRVLIYAISGKILFSQKLMCEAAVDKTEQWLESLSSN
ncbi:hypothetical protein GBAR_LOCUS16206 [Geodia barretti]|uniref:Uncharacterized protein n=1 Tax=Geodia barretti TaxID=519541 RepID=A0AA35WVR0_GEOBA|nr:hypothetical protein GBAR_LOCUS16206 [Geodia barretti]